MGKRKTFLIVGIVLGVFVLGVFSLFAYVSLQLRNVKAPLLTFLKSQIDGDLQIGEAKAVWFPAGIELKDVKLFAPGESVPSATVNRAQLRFNLLPLIQKKIETEVKVIEPDIRLTRGKDGKTNMEKIFAPLMVGEKKARATPLDRLWWKRLAVNQLLIEKAHFISSQEGSPKTTELKDITIEADEIRFESGESPARIRVRYDLPKLSKIPMELLLRLKFEEAAQALKVAEGRLSWGPALVNLGGEALLPSTDRKEVGLNLNFASGAIDLKKLSKILVGPTPAEGILTFRGTVTGTAFEPILKLVLDSPSLSLAGKTLSNLHAELSKKDKAIEIENAGFGIYGGTVQMSGTALPGETTSANLKLGLRSLSLGAVSGKGKSPARLSGDLQVAGSNVKNPNTFSGGGRISVGPFPLPVVNLQNKVKVGEVLASGTAAGRMVNFGMLSSSANLIGTQVDQIHASIRFGGGNINLSPFSLANGHFNASGSGTIVQQKSINASGTATLNSSVTAQLFPDPLFRAAVTGGKGVISMPFTLSGSLDNPDFNIDGGHLSGLIARAAATALPKLLMGGIQPNQMLGAALKNTPLADPKNPLGQILGTSPQPQQSPSTSRTQTTRTQTTTRQQTQTRQPPKTLGDLLFGK